MIEILHEYWKPLLWTDGYRFTGVAITLWLLILSVVIGGVLALFLAMIISSLIGTIIPMFFHKIKVDPAVASGPLITTVNDLVAVVTYYGLVGVLLVGMHLGG